MGVEWHNTCTESPKLDHTVAETTTRHSTRVGSLGAKRFVEHESAKHSQHTENAFIATTMALAHTITVKRRIQTPRRAPHLTRYRHTPDKTE